MPISQLRECDRYKKFLDEVTPEWYKKEWQEKVVKRQVRLRFSVPYHLVIALTNLRLNEPNASDNSSAHAPILSVYHVSHEPVLRLRARSSPQLLRLRLAYLLLLLLLREHAHLSLRHQPDAAQSHQAQERQDPMQRQMLYRC
jgi:hypothetical protein